MQAHLTSVHDKAGEQMMPGLSGHTRSAFMRRALLGGTAFVAGGALLRPAAAGAVSETFSSDVEVLNYALTLEHLEYAFYRDGLARFDQGDFTSAKFIRGFGGRIISRVYSNFVAIRAHEETHVDTLTDVISSLGGTPVQECNAYDFGYSNVNEFVAVAQLLENTGVSAYTGAAHELENDDLLTAAATIATVEARHASYLNLINGDSPFPDAFDDPKAPAEILAAAGGFITNCSNNA